MKQRMVAFSWLVVPFVAVLLLAGCEGPFLIDSSEYLVVPYDGKLSWQQIAPAPPWGVRQDAVAVVHDTKLWLLGGYDPTVRGDQIPYRSDVWSTSDGVHWSQVCADAPFNGLRGHASVSHNGSLFVIGGFEVDPSTGVRRYSNDVWRSEDGCSWTLVLPGGVEGASHPWKARMNHTVLSSGTSLYLMGGFYSGAYYLDDMWVSTDDGATWENVETITLGSEVTLPGERASFASAVDAGGKLYIQGGSFEDAIPSATGSVDTSVPGWVNLWMFDPAKPADGWKIAPKVKLKNAAARRSDHALEILDGSFWLLPGKANSSFRFSRDTATYSTEVYVPGTGWSTDSLGSGPGPRYGYASAVWEPLAGALAGSGKYIWVLGGMTDRGVAGDIWCGRQP